MIILHWSWRCAAAREPISARWRDLGDRLGCGGYIARLRRTQVGPFCADEGIGLNADAATARGRLLPLETAVRNLPRVELEAETALRFCSGGPVPLHPGDGECRGRERSRFSFRSTGKFLGVGAANGEEKALLPRKVISREIGN